MCDNNNGNDDGRRQVTRRKLLAMGMSVPIANLILGSSDASAQEMGPAGMPKLESRDIGELVNSPDGFLADPQNRARLFQYEEAEIHGKIIDWHKLHEAEAKERVKELITQIVKEIEWEKAQEVKEMEWEKAQEVKEMEWGGRLAPPTTTYCAWSFDDGPTPLGNR